MLRAVTTNEVLDALKEAWPRAAEYPDESGCYFIAGHVNAWVVRKNAKQIKKGPSQYEINAAHKNYVQMGKHARAFLKFSAMVIDDFKKRRRVQECTDVPGVVIDVRPDISAALAAIEAATLALKEIPPRNLPEWEDREPDKFIADAAIEAWRRIGVEVDLGRNDRSPLVKFVTAITEIAGWHQSEHTVSDHLRERQNRPRVRKVKPPANSRGQGGPRGAA